MKRWALRICMFLLLGAIVNVAVAWGLALLVNLSAWQPDYRVTSREDPFLMQSRGWVHAHGYQLMSFCAHSEDEQGNHGVSEPPPAWSPHDREPSDWMMQSGTSARQIQFIEARGWPRLALTSWYRIRRSSAVGMAKEQLHGIPVEFWPRRNLNGGYGQRVLPTGPIWPGFAINTLCYAAILWLMFAAPFALRRRRRLKRGLCPACAYPVGDSAACTECGTAIKQKAETQKAETT